MLFTCNCNIYSVVQGEKALTRMQMNPLYRQLGKNNIEVTTGSSST